MRRFIGPVIVGLGGVAVLVSLGLWQVQRMEVKAAKIAEVEAKIGGAPMGLPEAMVDDLRYQAVSVAGRLTGEAVFKLDSQRGLGPGKRVIAVLETGGRRVMVDLGLLPEGDTAVLDGPVQITGNLDLPQETDSFTPAPDGDLWFARDVPGMAAALGTEPLLIVADRTLFDAIVPVPVDSSSIPNDHREYAITWFSLALVWLVMTLALLWRIRRQNGKA